MAELFRTHFKRLIMLFAGLFLYSLAIVVNINSDVGMPPWDLFHTGFSMLTGFTIGTVNLFFSILLVISNVTWLKVKVGIGTLANMLFVGIFVDLINYLGFVPVTGGALGIVQLFIGMIIMCMGMYYYIDSGYGSGPRDSFFIGVSNKYGLSSKTAKMAIDIAVFVVGALLGAKFGVGTAIFAFGFGPLMQQVFKMLKFDVKGVEHQYIDDVLKKRKNNEEQEILK